MTTFKTTEPSGGNRATRHRNKQRCAGTTKWRPASKATEQGGLKYPGVGAKKNHMEPNVQQNQIYRHLCVISNKE